jgi:hypothetical protein
MPTRTSTGRTHLGATSFAYPTDIMRFPVCAESVLSLSVFFPSPAAAHFTDISPHATRLDHASHILLCLSSPYLWLMRDGWKAKAG